MRSQGSYSARSRQSGRKQEKKELMSSIDSQETVHVRSDSSDRPGGALTPSPPASTSSSSEDPTKGNDLSLSASYHATSPRANLLVLSVSVVFWHVVSANCHERMFVHGLSLPYFITTIEFAFNALVALAERVRMRRRLSAGFVKEHFFVALAMCVGHGASNAAFSMLNYTTQTLFKSSKVCLPCIVVHVRVSFPILHL